MAFTAEYIYRILDRYSGPLSKITRATERFRATAAGAQKQAGMMGRSMRDAGAKMTAGLTLPIVGLGVAAAKTAIDFQNAFIGVQKTVDATAPQLAVMRGQFEKMSTEIPVSATALMQIGESAGQLGIQTKNITSFTKTIAMLGATTNMSGEEGAKQLARFANITGMSQQNFDRLASTIVHLGNNLATSEAEIVNMSLGLAMAGKTVGLSESQIMGFAGALSSIGIEAEAGSTAFSRALYGINNAIGKNGPQLRKFASIAGMSTQKFAELFKKDASKGMLSFITGLGKMPKDKINIMLDALGFKEVRLVKALTGAALASDLFNKSVIEGDKAWAENAALSREAELRFKSWGSQLFIAWNKLKLIANDLGKIIVPMFITFIDKAIVPLVNWFKSWPTVIKKVAVVLAGLTAIIGPLIAAVGMLSIAFAAISLPVLILIAKVALVVAVISAFIAILVTAYRSSGAFRQSLSNLYDAFSPLIELMKIVVMWVGKKLAQAFGLSGTGIKNWADGVAIAINAVAAVVSGLINLITNAAQFWKNVFQGDFMGALKSIPGANALMEKIGFGAAKDKAAARQDNKMEISGQIGVTASGGAQVKRAEINLNTGYNLAVAH